MPTSDKAAPAPLYLELAPPAGAPAQIDHFFVYCDCGLLSGPGTGRFATDLFTLSLTLRGGADRGPRPRLDLEPPRPAFSPRRAPFEGAIAGMRLDAAPHLLPSEGNLDALTLALLAVAGNGEAWAPLVAALDQLACDLTFSGCHSAPASARSERRRVRAATGMSRRRLAATRRFRTLLDGLAARDQALSELALDAGYYDQSHMSAVCRAFADAPPGVLRRLARARPSGRFFQDQGLETRLRLLIDP
ncbi:helix-turn-helix domain-containing protein [Neoaquamicrobium sediminum]|uniref:Helix-turn-helix domain-containing protein n=1 Tax=Neoaquamicrobium sediminum TaxID=1849104 RepID=A0ABV3WZY3_9HYPH|nr:helix-turn-helix domain-containing protein [Mesorhizobium sediminum]MCV0398311.1 helix-turn-helix domain-containing protein [Rhizobiaceae bacterium]MCV0406685.1 helix-turn-helix domain-containing protein [Rhizobiaceae bacterium]NRC57115.1 AraC family transcriptional regulator [Mesorhizobium sediminum]